LTVVREEGRKDRKRAVMATSKAELRMEQSRHCDAEKFKVLSSVVRCKGKYQRFEKDVCELTGMDFNEEGFLGTAISDFTKAVESRYSDFFDACNKINKLAQGLKFELQIHNKDGREVLVATLFLRILNAYQAIILVTKLGLIVEAKVVLRSAIESLFILRLLSQDRKFLTEYVGSDEVRRLKWMNVALDSKSTLFDKLRDHATSALREELKGKIDKNQWKELKTIDVASRAGLKEMYDTDYRLLSEEVHTLPISMEYLLGADEDGDIRTFEWGPTDKGIDYVLFTAIRVLFISLVALAELFELNKAEDLRSIDATLHALAERLSP